MIGLGVVSGNVPMHRKERNVAVADDLFGDGALQEASHA